MAFKREHKMLQSCEDIISRLEGKQVCTVLGLKNGFWKIALVIISHLN